MKRPRCKQCKHTMKGHKKQRCESSKTLLFEGGALYEGTVYENKPSGLGTLKDSEKTYHGHWLSGKKHGHGVETWYSGRKYEGEWRSGLLHGHGHLISTSGCIYEGSFHTGTYHGQGTITYARGTYCGQWNHGTYHGHGRHVTDQGIYEGQFYYNVRHGNGTFTDVRGNIFSGKWRKGLREGRGVHTTTDGTYTGDWAHDLQSGHGRWVSKRHGIYVGGWRRGKRHRKGTQIYNDGTTYNGWWSKGNKTGHGVQTWPNGDCYVGFWFKDEYNGRGTLTLSGTTFTGEWEKGKREGIFIETLPTGEEYSGPWVNDVRHGTFQGGIGDKLLYIWNTHVQFTTSKTAEKSAINMIKCDDFEGARVVLQYFPKLINWKFFWKYDRKGILVYLLQPNQIVDILQSHSWKLFKSKRYEFLKHLMEKCPENSLIIDTTPELFDALSKDFVANPWIVHAQSYSEETKNKLLEGIHLGEFGRCPPKDPFTRLPLTEESGTYLSDDKKKAKEIYTSFMKSIGVKPGIREIAYSFDIQDFEECLKNAREVNDRTSITRIMQERNEYIQQNNS